jgi:drug/metabolite transporter (DMT)-like permease
VKLLAVLGIALIFASNHIAARFAFNDGASVSAAVLLRSIITVTVLTLLIRLMGQSFRISRENLKHNVIVGFLIAFQSFCLYSAVARLPVGLALLIFSLFSLVFLVSNQWINGVKAQSQTLWTIPFILGGLFLALNGPQLITALSTDSRTSAGMVFALGAALSFGLAMTFTERWLKPVDGKLRTLISLSVVGVIAAIVTPLVGVQWPQSSTGWLGLILLAVFYGTAFTLFFSFTAKLDLQRNAPAMNIEPVAALLLAWPLLGQRLDAIQIIGALIVVAAIIALGLLNR